MQTFLKSLVGVFVAPIMGSGVVVGPARVATGDTWTPAADNNWDSVTFGNGLFVAVSYYGTGDRVMTSPDGITWTSRAE